MFDEKKIVSLVGILIFLGSSILFASSQSNQITTYGPQFEKICEDNACQTKIYSYEKYFFNGEDWEEIDENWYNCNNGFCTKNYYFNTTANSNGLVSSYLNNQQFNVQLSNLLNAQINFNPTISGSVITYENVIPNVDLRYQYLPRKLKEEIVIKQHLGNVNSNFNILFAKSGNANFVIPKSTICDARGYCEFINHTITNTEISVLVPIEFLTNETTEYPVVIDPTLYLNDSDIAWNGRVEENFDYDENPYPRTNNPTTFYLGMIGTNGRGMGDIDWNVSSITDNSDLYNITLQLYIESTHSGNFINITEMTGDSFFYSDDITGNEHFYKDIGNGTNYSFASSFSTGDLSFSFNNLGKNDLEYALTDDDIFSTGIDSDSSKKVSISARDHANANQRPLMIVTYGVNQSDVDAAIEEGIDGSAVSGNPIQTDQQIYLVNENGDHFLGVFDKATGKDNQTWAFSYVTSSESFLNIPSLFDILNVWENSSLTYGEIVEQVGSFINGTVM